jgi:hypothetical protein
LKFQSQHLAVVMTTISITPHVFFSNKFLGYPFKATFPRILMGTRLTPHVILLIKVVLGANNAPSNAPVLLFAQSLQ